MEQGNFNIKIGNSFWDVYLVGNKDPRLDGNRGFCNYQSQMIFIDKTEQVNEITNILCHEVTHAILCESTFNIQIKDGLGSFYENFVESFAKGMRNTFIDCNIEEKINNAIDKEYKRLNNT